MLIAFASRLICGTEDGACLTHLGQELVSKSTQSCSYVRSPMMISTVSGNNFRVEDRALGPCLWCGSSCKVAFHGIVCFWGEGLGICVAQQQTIMNTVSCNTCDTSQFCGSGWAGMGLFGFSALHLLKPKARCWVAFLCSFGICFCGENT